jgi:hypothetical protein
MREVILQKINEGAFDASTRATLEAWLAGRAE